jgi:hypothetical protein
MTNTNLATSDLYENFTYVPNEKVDGQVQNKDETGAWLWNVIPFPNKSDGNDNKKGLIDEIAVTCIEEEVLGNYNFELLRTLKKKNHIEYEDSYDIINNKVSLKEDVLYTPTRDISILQAELKVMQIKLKNCLPVPAITYMVTTAIAFSVFFTLYLLQVLKGVYIIHPYYAFTGIIGSAGLFLTAFLSIRDWKEFINNEKHS